MLEMEVAIIDDGVSKNPYFVRHVRDFLEVNYNNKICKQTDSISPLSHGSVCTGIILSYNNYVNIYSIRILNKEMTSGIDKLITAFQWCVENNINIVNLSLGTTNPKDYIKMRKHINDLVDKRIIVVAALNNKNTYTEPASLKKVIGVSTEKNGNEISFVDDELTGKDIIAPSEHLIKISDVKNIFSPYSNSCAAPSVTGEICNLFMNKKIDKNSKLYHKIDSKLNANFSFFNDAMWTDISKVDIELLKNIKKKVPIIEFCCAVDEIEKIKNLFYDENFYPIVLYSSIRNIKYTLYKDDIYKICALTDCDLVISYNIKNVNIERDVIVFKANIGFVIKYKFLFISRYIPAYSIDTVFKYLLKILC